MSSLKSRDGKPSGMVYGFANFISTLKKDFPSDYIVFALDSGGKTFRSQIDPNYKTNRTPPPDALKAQLPVCIDMIEKMGFCSMRREGYEADDIIASFIANNPDPDLRINVVTHDKDLYQLIDERVSVYSPAKKELYGREGCHEKYGVYPEQIRDFLALCGDSADNIPGVKGIGEKGAKTLLDEYGSIEGIYSNLSMIRNERTKNMLAAGRENAELSKRLATLYNGLDTPNIETAEFPSENPLLRVVDILEDYSLSRLVGTLGLAQKPLKFESNLILKEEELERLVESVDENTLVAFDTETTGLDAKNVAIVGFSFCFDGSRAYYVPLAHNYLGAPAQVSMKCAAWAISQLFKGFVVGHNLKYDFAVVAHNFGLTPPPRFADTMILAWLQNPGESVGMDSLAQRLYGYETIKFEDTVAKGETFASVEVGAASRYASEDAWITFRFYETLRSTLEPRLLEIARDVEFPFVLTLLNMEAGGVKLDRNALREMIASNAASLTTLSREIYELCGESFNINSTKQLGEVLFERLALPAKKKTKTGYSTDESVLSGLLGAHPVIAKLLEYRELYKLQTTYCEPLLALASKREDSRVFSSFIQTGTATGRLASKNPNLQNIPARGARAKQMRSAFIAQEGFSLISLDYSQIELRLLAHFSEDPALLAAFIAGEDIHARSAINIFGDAQPEHRAIAKSINFGLIYGMGANKLAGELGLDKKAAKDYIERYFTAFETIKDFLDGIKQNAHNDGFVTTLLGRKRFFDFADANGMRIAMYEREAVNTKFQGSAADIIKLAMNEIYSNLNADARMILQIHDELIFEVRDEIARDFAAKAQEIMQEVVSLKVPLKTSVSIAKNWGDLK